MHARRNPRPGSWEYTHRFEFQDLAKMMMGYKRAKYSYNQSALKMEVAELDLQEQATKLKIEVRLDDLSECAPSDTE